MPFYIWIAILNIGRNIGGRGPHQPSQLCPFELIRYSATKKRDLFTDSVSQIAVVLSAKVASTQCDGSPATVLRETFKVL